MDHQNYFIGLDMGGSGGKMAAATFDGNKLHILERIAVQNRPIEILDSFYWDVFDIHRSIIQNLIYCAQKYGKAQSIGIDTWGASYGFLDKFGRLAEPVYHYRDIRTKNTMEQMHNQISAKEIFELSGCQPNRTYSLPQLFASVLRDESILKTAKTLLFLPDLLGYYLTGEISTERTIAGTSSLLQPDQQNWAYKLFDKCNINTNFLTKIIDAGNIKGTITDKIAGETGIGNANLVAVPGHDTACAIAALPHFGENQLYLSIGTNVNMGIETTSPIVSDQAFEGGFKNAGGLDNKIIVYRDLQAFWIISLLMKQFKSKGNNYSFDDVQNLAINSKSVGSYIDVEHPVFSLNSSDVIGDISRYLKQTNQNVPETSGEFILCVFESIAIKIKSYSNYLQNKLNIPLRKALAVNGGSRNEFLVQLICDAINMPISGGMPFATLDGNILSQLYAQKYIGSLSQLREVSAASFEMKQYEPTKMKDWNIELECMKQKGICI